MTVEQYKLRNAENRAHMEAPMPPEDLSSVTATKVSVYLPEWRTKSTVPEKPPMEDLSHMNSKSWAKLKAAGKRNGRRPKV